MRRSRFSEEQIIGILREQEAGMKVADVCRKHGISDATFYTWKSKYGGLEVSEARRLKSLEDENRRLKKLLAEAVLDNAALKDLLGKNADACGAAQGGGAADHRSRVQPASCLQADWLRAEHGPLPVPAAGRCRPARSAARAGGRTSALRLSTAGRAAGT